MQSQPSLAACLVFPIQASTRTLFPEEVPKYTTVVFVELRVGNAAVPKTETSVGAEFRLCHGPRQDSFMFVHLDFAALLVEVGFTGDGPATPDSMFFKTYLLGRIA